MGSRSRGWRDSADSKGKPRVDSHHHKLVRGQKGLYLVSEAAQLCRHLDFQLQSSRSGREQISVVSSHLVVLHDVIAAVRNEQNSQEQEKKLFYTHTPTNVRLFMKRIDTLAWIHTSIHHFQGLPDLMSSSLAKQKTSFSCLEFFPEMETCQSVLVQRMPDFFCFGCSASLITTTELIREKALIASALLILSEEGYF